MIIKGSHNDKSIYDTLNNCIINDSGQVEQLHIKTGQFLLIHSNLYIAEGGSTQQNARFLGSTNNYPMTHISIKSMIYYSHRKKEQQNKRK